MSNHESRLVPLEQKINFSFIEEFWQQEILPTLQEYIKIPNKSPQFDKNWVDHGYMQQACQLIYDWCKSHALPDMQIQVLQLPQRTPLLFIDIPGQNDDTVLLYGHFDKQPEMTGWDKDLHPWKPVLKDDRLYGRGAADDGYAAFASIASIKALREQNLPHARCVIIIEGCEESGSYDLPYYIDALKDQIGQPSLVICLDSGCGNYNQLWVTTSLRGLVSGTLTVEVLKQGIHSGQGSGVVPSCFRILRMLLDRVEDVSTGNIIATQFHAAIPETRKKQAQHAANVLSGKLETDLPFVNPDVKSEASSYMDLILRRTWHPALSIVGMDNMPSIENAGNVTLPKLATKLSLRIPPTSDCETLASNLQILLEKQPPYHANITFDINDVGPGWNAPLEEAWLTQAIDEASIAYFGHNAVYMGEGGSIPFMGMLGEKFPQAQFVITGVLGPGSNAHGPNEFLHLPTAKKLTACVAQIISDHFGRSDKHG